jgi:hypothetical protein
MKLGMNVTRLEPNPTTYFFNFQLGRYSDRERVAWPGVSIRGKRIFSEFYIVLAAFGPTQPLSI